MKPNVTRVIYYLMWIMFISIFIAANKTDIKKYSPYTVLAWEIKANEGYRSWWYPDGHFIVNGKRKNSFSIGFGWNDLGTTRRHEVKQYTADGKVTIDEAWAITLKEINKWPRFHNDDYKNLAMQLYSYNCGRIRSSSQLGKCHNGTNARNKRCGHWCKSNGKNGHKCINVRKAHNVRRELELALWKHDWIAIYNRSEENREKVDAINQQNKKRK